MRIQDMSLGSRVVFTPCSGCSGKLVCFFCKKGVKNVGEVVALWFDFDIPTVEVKVKGADKHLELTQDDLDNPEIVSEVQNA